MTTPQKNYLIFGGIDGIGGALSARLKAGGHRVFVTTSNPEKAEAALQSGIAQDQIFLVDALSPESIAQAVAGASAEGLHGLAYCVGTIDLKPLSRTTTEDLLKSFQVNVLGAFMAIKAAAPHLAQELGSIVLFSSIAATRGFANHASIGTAKAALEGLARSLAAELAPKVRINVIAPSLTETPLATPFTSNPKMKDAIAAMHPLQRLGIPDEMAALAAFLLSEESGWITGQTVHVDGGRSRLESIR
jgi:NAD(P)-dependent dehydrogenase (short-subunit alcohol dehydrogenase family)